MKRWLAIVMLFLLLASEAQAAIGVRMADGALLLDRYGNEIALQAEYMDIIYLGNGYFAAERDGAYALMDADGTELTRPVYNRLQVSDGAILAERNGFWGMLSADGTPLCGFEYSWILPNGEGGCWAMRGELNDNESDMLLLLDETGTETATELQVRRFAREASQGLLAVQPVGEVKFGYCNARGEMVIAAEYEYAGRFHGDIALIVQDGKYGVIDRSGAKVIAAEYDFMEISDGGNCIVAKDTGGAYAFDASGALIAEYPGTDLQIGLAGEKYVLSDAESVRVYDADGVMLHALSPQTAVNPGLDGQLIFSDGAWGESCVFLEGTQAKYQHIYPLGNAGDGAVYACMQVNVVRYVNELLGEIQLSVDMDSARWGAIDADGNRILECLYESVELVDAERLLVQIEGVWQLMDLEGKVYWQSESTQSEEASSASDS